MKKQKKNNYRTATLILAVVFILFILGIGTILYLSEPKQLDESEVKIITISDNLTFAQSVEVASIYDFFLRGKNVLFVREKEFKK